MKEELVIHIFGDICPDRNECKKFESVEDVFGDVFPFVRKGDITICNLEAPASDCGEPIEKCGANLHGKRSDIDLLGDAGINVISLANNHILDYGKEALEDTLTAIKERGLYTVGAGINLTSARMPLFVEKKGRRIGIISFAEHEFNVASVDLPGANLFDPYTSLGDIKMAKKQCDYLIVLYHGGVENYVMPSPLLQKKCRAMADMGADIILCQHSHCIGTFEEYNGTTILYGQGNSVFGRIEGKNEWNQGLLVSIYIGESEKEVSFSVLEAVENGIHFAEKEIGEEVLSKFYDASASITDSEYVAKKWKEFCCQNAKWYLPMLFCWDRYGNKLNRMLNNRLIGLFVRKNKLRTAMNLIRCDAHREVLQTALEENIRL